MASFLDRRSFLSAGAWTVGGLMLPHLDINAGDGEYELAPTPAIVANPTAFFGEAGNYKWDNYYVLGMLTSEKEQTDEAAFKALRNTHKYRTKLSYNNTDKFKMAFCEAVLQYFAQSSDMRFVAKVIPWSGGPSGDTFGKLTLEKVALYFDLENTLGSKKPLKSLIKSHSPYGPSIFFKDKFKNKTNHSVTPTNARNSDLLQFAGLLAGCVLREIKGPVQSSTKAAVVNKLKEKLGVSSIGVGTNALGGKFKVT